MRKLIKFSNWLDNHWVGDVIGIVCLFGTAWSIFMIAYGIGY
jgi:hypothetical protein